VYRAGGRQAVYPLDPDGGGTWIGINDTGLVVALLNHYGDTPRRAPDPRRSRGIIVRGVLGCATLGEATIAAASLDLARFAPFRLVMLQHREVSVATALPARMEIAGLTIRTPLLFTSSGLGDARVAGPRQRLFERLVLHRRGDWLAGQSRFHVHQWPGRPELSVRMERGDALTVSRTIVDVGPRLRTMRYEAPIASGHGREIRQWCSLH
jgi:hypothetical protein